MPASNRNRQSLLAAARRVLEAEHGPAEGPVTVTAVVVRGPAVLVSDAAVPAGAAPDPGGLPADLRAILDVLEPGPLRAKEIAVKVGRRYNSKLRSQLAELVRHGRVVRGGGLYRRA